MIKHVAIAVGLVAFVAAMHGEAQSKCTGAKVKATRKNAAAKGGCYANAVAKGLPLPGACAATVLAADAKLAMLFAKAEAAADCLAPVGDAVPTAAAAIGFVGGAWGVVNGLGAGPSKCDGAKIKAAALGAGGKLKCHEKLLRVGPLFLPFLPGGLAKAEARFMAAVAKAEFAGVGPGLCSAVGQAVPPPPPNGPLGSVVDGFEAAMVAALCDGPGC